MSAARGKAHAGAESARGRSALSSSTDADKQHVVTRQLNGLIVDKSDLLTSPQVLAGQAAMRTERRQDKTEGMSGNTVAACVQHGDSKRSTASSIFMKR